jgi:hypothetical protein
MITQKASELRDITFKTKSQLKLTANRFELHYSESQSAQSTLGLLCKKVAD